MATDPHMWARMFAQDAAGMRDNALAHHDNALMSIFREEAARQHPYAVMPARLAEANFDRQNRVPLDIAAEQRAFDTWTKQRRFQQQLDIEEALAIAAGGGLPTGVAGGVLNIGGRNYQLRAPAAPPSEEE